MDRESSETMPGPFDPAVSAACKKEVRVPPGEAKARTMEERRAFLGYWFISSVYVHYSYCLCCVIDSSQCGWILPATGYTDLDGLSRVILPDT
jgi:hypothetical protein